MRFKKWRPPSHLASRFRPILRFLTPMAVRGHARRTKFAFCNTVLTSYKWIRGFPDFRPRFQNDRPQIHARSRLGSRPVWLKIVFKCRQIYAIWKSWFSKMEREIRKSPSSFITRRRAAKHIFRWKLGYLGTRDLHFWLKLISALYQIQNCCARHSVSL